MQALFRDGVAADFREIAAINRMALPHVAALDGAEFALLMRCCDRFRVAVIDGQVAGYLFAMRSRADYKGEEFIRFRETLNEPFYYIDQVAVAPEHRGKGLARHFYSELERHAQAESVGLLACEVNKVPANVASLAFHERLGFSETGEMETRGVVVSLLNKNVISQ
ncbi:MAG: GNAT family N-acetyltransferase [Parvibaculaceae bacterium]